MTLLTAGHPRRVAALLLAAVVLAVAGCSATASSTHGPKPVQDGSDPATPVPRARSGNLAGLLVSGGRLMAGGAPVRLRGMDVSGTEFVCAQDWTADPYGGQPLGAVSTFAAMAAWGANVVRIPLNEDCWLGINGVEIGGAVYRQAIAREVAAAENAGLYVILDLHWSAPGSQRALSQNPAPDEDHSPAFWGQVAAAYKGDGAVLFDLFNEPYDYWGSDPDPWNGWLHGDTQSQYLTGGTPYTVASPWKTAGMQQLINVVRASGAHNPVLANGLDWANDDSGWLTHAPTDPDRQLIVGAHIYPGQSCSTPSCWQGVFPAMEAAGYPVLVGETGDKTAAGANWLTSTFFPFADAHGFNYLAWTWNPWSTADNLLITNWAATPTPGEGTEWRNHLLVPNPS